MAVKQVTFEIPDSIQRGLDEGNLVRYGGIVRDTAGQIVKHLKEKELPSDKKVQKGFVEIIKENKKFLLGTAIVTAIVVGVSYVVVKNKKNQDVKVPKCVVDFNESFIKYISSIKSGTVTKKKIDDVIISLNEIIVNQQQGNVDIELSVENINILLDMVRDYTLKFAEANSYEVPETFDNMRKELDSLEYYLEIQKEIFENANRVICEK